MKAADELNHVITLESRLISYLAAKSTASIAFVGFCCSLFVVLVFLFLGARPGSLLMIGNVTIMGFSLTLFIMNKKIMSRHCEPLRTDLLEYLAMRGTQGSKLATEVIEDVRAEEDLNMNSESTLNSVSKWLAATMTDLKLSAGAYIDPLVVKALKGVAGAGQTCACFETRDSHEADCPAYNEEIENPAAVIKRLRFELSMHSEANANLEQEILNLRDRLSKYEKTHG